MKHVTKESCIACHMDIKDYMESLKPDMPPMPALCNACIIGNTKMVDKLLVCGADVESEAKGGMTALMLAALYGHKQIFKNLLQYGANLQVQNEAGFTALDYVDSTDKSPSETPFYDWISSDPQVSARDYANVGSRKSDHGILNRRKKSLPKIKVHQELATDCEGNHHYFIKRNVANIRYSPYLRPEQSNCKIANRISNTQILSPTVANFFGNILHMRSSNFSSINTDSTFEAQAAFQKCVRNKSFCPLLYEVLKRCGCQHLIPIFEYHEVNFQVFCSLTDVDLIQIGVKNISHRNQLLQIIRRERSRFDTTDLM